MPNAHDNLLVEAVFTVRIDAFNADPDLSHEGGPNITISLCDGLALDLSWWNPATVNEIWVPSGGSWSKVRDISNANVSTELEVNTVEGQHEGGYRMGGSRYVNTLRDAPAWRLPWHLRLRPVQWRNDIGSISYQPYPGLPGYWATEYPAQKLTTCQDEWLSTPAEAGTWQRHSLRWVRRAGGYERLVWKVDLDTVLDAETDAATVSGLRGSSSEVGWHSPFTSSLGFDARRAPRDLLGYMVAEDQPDGWDARVINNRAPLSWKHTSNGDDSRLAWVRPRPRITCDRADVTVGRIGLAVNGVTRYHFDKFSDWRDEYRTGVGTGATTLSRTSGVVLNRWSTQAPTEFRPRDDGPNAVASDEGLSIATDDVLDVVPLSGPGAATAATLGPLGGPHAHVAATGLLAVWPKYVPLASMVEYRAHRYWQDVGLWSDPPSGGIYKNIVQPIAPHQYAVPAAPAWNHGPYRWAPSRFREPYPLGLTRAGRSYVSRANTTITSIPDPQPVNGQMPVPQSYVPGIPFDLPLSNVAAEGQYVYIPVPADYPERLPVGLAVQRNGEWAYARRPSDALADAMWGTFIGDRPVVADAWVRRPDTLGSETSLFAACPERRPTAPDWTLAVDRTDNSMHLVGLREVLTGSGSGTDASVVLWRQSLAERDAGGICEAADTLTLPAFTAGELGWMLADACFGAHGALWVALWRVLGNGQVRLLAARQERYADEATIVWEGLAIDPPANLRASLAPDPMSGETLLWYLPPGEAFRVVSLGLGAPVLYTVPCPAVPTPPYGAWLDGTSANWRLLWAFVEKSGRSRLRMQYAGWFDARGTFPEGYTFNAGINEDLGCYGVHELADICDLTCPTDPLSGGEFTIEDAA